ncbi:hypothetical protein X943_003570 [Babesia divergens]|uniref:Uncharacterized protein n=1 Tax=Babesia divergens TaxID=32595 RepID=A0AAD9GKP8_BABDI|nr:hypothetical protein X943_003570 [Babesia divergens]
MGRSSELGSLKKRAVPASPLPSSAECRVAAYQELNKIKRGLPKSLISEFEKRKVTNVEEAAKVARALRAKRVKSHKVVKAKKSTKASKRSKGATPGELSRPGGSTAHKAIAALKQALNSGVVKL